MPHHGVLALPHLACFTIGCTCLPHHRVLTLLASPQGAHTLLASPQGAHTLLASPQGAHTLLASPQGAHTLLASPQGAHTLLASPHGACLATWCLPCHMVLASPHYVVLALPHGACLTSLRGACLATRPLPASPALFWYPPALSHPMRPLPPYCASRALSRARLTHPATYMLIHMAAHVYINIYIFIMIFIEFFGAGLAQCRARCRGRRAGPDRQRRQCRRGGVMGVATVPTCGRVASLLMSPSGRDPWPSPHQLSRTKSPPA